MANEHPESGALKVTQRPMFPSLVPETGFLTDNRMRAALNAEYLIEPGTWDATQIRHASYTLRLGSRVEVERGEDAHRQIRQRIAHTLTKGGPPLVLRPGDTALLYSLENLRLPACVLGFTVARGLLFVESLVPENTYIDPGFRGQIYTTVTNVSGRLIELSYGTPIARLFFCRLSNDVDQEYATGSAIGIEQHLPSQPGVKFGTTGDARRAATAELLADLETSERGGKRTRELLRRQATMSQVALLTAVVWPTLLHLATSWQWLRDEWGVFSASVAASIVAAMIVLGAQKLWNRILER